ncbi:hypothetical protein AKJ16_DCAP13682 [Drosera capensis]
MTGESKIRLRVFGLNPPRIYQPSDEEHQRTSVSILLEHHLILFTCFRSITAAYVAQCSQGSWTRLLMFASEKDLVD